MLLRAISKRKEINIVVPVYGDIDSLSENVEALVNLYSRNSKIKVYFIDDNGPDSDLITRMIQNKIKGLERFYYFKNDKNLGFVKNCNNAVDNIINKGGDVLLLNSDAVVTQGSIEEMHKVLYSSKNIAAVCPRSNAATIFSIPVNNASLDAEQSYILFKKIKSKLPKYYISPIAHGFCMLIKREVINKYGLFDEVYGAGYGEENDFCMRIRQKGYKCAVSNRAFVRHYKARSFTSERRSKLVEKNEKILYKRYPEYLKLVVDYAEDITSKERDLI